MKKLREIITEAANDNVSQSFYDSAKSELMAAGVKNIKGGIDKDFPSITIWGDHKELNNNEKIVVEIQPGKEKASGTPIIISMYTTANPQMRHTRGGRDSMPDKSLEVGRVLNMPMLAPGVYKMKFDSKSDEIVLRSIQSIIKSNLKKNLKELVTEAVSSELNPKDIEKSLKKAFSSNLYDNKSIFSFGDGQTEMTFNVSINGSIEVSYTENNGGFWAIEADVSGFTINRLVRSAGDARKDLKKIEEALRSIEKEIADGVVERM
jgi:hypothetical protein